MTKQPDWCSSRKVLRLSAVDGRVDGMENSRQWRMPKPATASRAATAHFGDADMKRRDDTPRQAAGKERIHAEGLRRSGCAGAECPAGDAAGVVGVLRHRRRRRDHVEGERHGVAEAQAAPARAARHRRDRHQREPAGRAGEHADHGGADRPASSVPCRGRTRHRARRGGGRRALRDVDQRRDPGRGRRQGARRGAAMVSALHAAGPRGDRRAARPLRQGGLQGAGADGRPAGAGLEPARRAHAGAFPRPTSAAST